MINDSAYRGLDVMQVCRNGHVVTDRFHSQPERQRSCCDECGAVTLHCCPTCGTEFAGAATVHGLVTVGQRQPPQFCSTCGAAFPWTKKREEPPGDSLLPALETLLRRLPRTIRQLRSGNAAGQAFRVQDERDLECLLRAVLPLCCDDVRLQSRTPSYSPFTRNDLVLMPDRIVVTAKLVSAPGTGNSLEQQLHEDCEYYQRQKRYPSLVVLIYDPQGLLRESASLEAVWSRSGDHFEVRCFIAG